MFSIKPTHVTTAVKIMLVTWSLGTFQANEVIEFYQT